MSDKSQSLFDLLDRPIAYHRCFVKLTGKVTAAVMLSQAVYWSHRTDSPEGWFYKTQAEWEEETGLTRSEQETARAALKKLGFWHEKREGLPAKMFFRLDRQMLEKLLLKLPQSSMRESCKLERGNPAIKKAGKPQSGTRESRNLSDSEITSEITSESVNSTDVQSGAPKPKSERPKLSAHAKELLQICRLPETLSEQQLKDFNEVEKLHRTAGHTIEEMRKLFGKDGLWFKHFKGGRNVSPPTPWQTWEQWERIGVIAEESGGKASDDRILAILQERAAQREAARSAGVWQ